MAAVTSPGVSSARSQLPPPCPKSPPDHSDLYGRRREMAMVHMLEREIGFLEEELKSAEGFQPASRCCEEITDFVVANSDPLMPTNREDKSTCRFWKWLCSPVVNFPIPWSCFCCYAGCSSPPCCSVGDEYCCSCLTCSAPKSSPCFTKSTSCSKNCCNPHCTRKPSCPKVPLCCNCTRTSCCNNQCSVHVASCCCTI